MDVLPGPSRSPWRRLPGSRIELGLPLRKTSLTTDRRSREDPSRTVTRAGEPAHAWRRSSATPSGRRPSRCHQVPRPGQRRRPLSGAGSL